jgi:hypothetical protein
MQVQNEVTSMEQLWYSKNKSPVCCFTSFIESSRTLPNWPHYDNTQLRGDMVISSKFLVSDLGVRFAR